MVAGPQCGEREEREEGQEGVRLGAFLKSTVLRYSIAWEFLFVATLYICLIFSLVRRMYQDGARGKKGMWSFLFVVSISGGLLACIALRARYHFANLDLILVYRDGDMIG